MFEPGAVIDVAGLRSLFASAPAPGRAFTTVRADWESLLDGTLKQTIRLYSAAVAVLTPAERFTQRTGLPALPEHGYFADSLTEDVARAAQARLVDADRVARIADAHRTVALLDAYTSGIEDLRVRFGPQIGSRGGKGAQAFFATVGSQTQQHPLHIAHVVDTALVAKERLPKTWAVYLAGETTWRALDLAVKHAAGLDEDVWAAYDEQAAGLVAGATRLKDRLRKLRERLQDDTAPKRARTAFEQRAVHLDPGPDGSATLSLSGPAVDLVAFDQALTKAAVAAHGNDDLARTVTQLRFDVARDLLIGGISSAVAPTSTPAPAPASVDSASADPATADPSDLRPDEADDGDGGASGPGAGAGAGFDLGAAGAGSGASAGWAVAVPQRKPVDVRLVLTIPTLAWLGHTNEQAQLAGYGPIDLDTAKRLAGDARSMVRVLTDPVTGVRTTMDRTVYSPPPDLRRWLSIRDQWCRFPGCRRPAHLCDVDHAHEWHEGGVTDAVNLISVCRSHHDAKSLDLYQEHLHPDGAVYWTDPWGNVLIDPAPDPMDPAPAHLHPAPASELASEPGPDADDEPCPF